MNLSWLLCSNYLSLHTQRSLLNKRRNSCSRSSSNVVLFCLHSILWLTFLLIHLPPFNLPKSSPRFKTYLRRNKASSLSFVTHISMNSVPLMRNEKNRQILRNKNLKKGSKMSKISKNARKKEWKIIKESLLSNGKIASKNTRKS